LKLPKLGEGYFGLSVISLGNIISNAIGGILWLLFASFMQVDSYGEISFYIALATVVGSAVPLGTETVLMTYLPKEKNQRLVHQAASLTLLVSSAAAASLALVNWQTSLLVLGVAYFAVNTSQILGSFRYKEYAMIIILERISRLGLSLLFFFLIGPFGILVGFTVSHIVLSLRFFNALKKLSLSFDALRPKFSFSMYSLGWTMMQLVPTLLDKAIIALFFSFTSVGFYQIGMQFVSLAGIIPTSIYQYMLPKRSEGKLPKSIITYGIGISIIIAALFVFVSPIVITTFFSHFSDAKLLVQIVGIAIIPITITAMMNSIMQADGRAKRVFVGGIMYVALLVSGLILLGMLFDIIGLGLAFVIANAAQTAFTVVSVKSH